MRLTLLNLFHELTHPGQKETLRRIAARYYWPSIRKDVSSYVSACHGCRSVKSGRQITPPMDPIPVVAKRFSSLVLDVVGPLPVSSGFRYLLTIVDSTSRWVDAVPMATATSAECCSAFIQSWVKTFGLPCTARSDNGNSFVARLWQDMHAKLGTIVSYSPVYAPQAAGMVERQHRDLKVGLRAALVKMADEKGESWHSALPWVLLGRHNSFHVELQATPSEVVFGEDMRLPGDIDAPFGPDKSLQDLIKRVKGNADRPAAPTALHKSVPVYMPSDVDTADHVYVKRAKTSPLSPKADGPFPILKRIGKSSLEVQVGTYKNGQPRTEVHHWRNCQPYKAECQTPAVRPTLGRKPLNPGATSFVPK